MIYNHVDNIERVFKYLPTRDTMPETKSTEKIDRKRFKNDRKNLESTEKKSTEKNRQNVSHNRQKKI